MASIGLQIAAAFVAALEAASAGGMSKPAGLTVHRFRARPIEEDDLPAQIVFPADEVNEVADNLRLLRSLKVMVESRVEVPAEGYADTALDPLYLWSVKALKADESLGGLAIQIIEGPRQWDNEIYDNALAMLSQEWTVQYLAREFDPENN